MTGQPGMVGVIGLGQMGSAMCRTLLRAGWRVAGWDISSRSVEDLARDGVEPVSGPAEMAGRTRLVIACLPDAAAVRAVALGDGGLVHGDCVGLTLIDTSTISPAAARELAADLAPHHVSFVDAPVSGGVGAARSGRLGVMVGGSLDAVERSRAVLSAVGKTVVHCGPVGAGQVAKACNQLIVMATHEAVAEALVLARVAGLDPWRIREAMAGGYAASPILEVQGPRMIDHDFAPGGKAIYHLKDIATIEGIAREAGLSLPVFDAAARQIERLVDQGGGELDNSALITMVEPRPGPS